MKPLDCFESVKKRMEQTDAAKTLFPDEIKKWNDTSEEDKEKKLQRICSVPLCEEDFTIMYTLYYRLKWMEVFRCCIPQGKAAVLEVGSGSSVNIPNAMTMYDSDSKYITANENKLLTEGFRRNTAALPITIEIIEDDANNIKNHIASDTVDIIVFEHSVNDILQAILCEENGVDTIHSNWFKILPEMINMISEAYINQTLEQKVKGAFLSLINNCLSVLKPGGYLVMSHYMFQYDLDLGYNYELWENILPIIRPWLKELSAGREAFMDGFDPQWWLFYQKRG